MDGWADVKKYIDSCMQSCCPSYGFVLCFARFQYLNYIQCKCRINDELKKMLKETVMA
jgi:hypothetical protein